MTKTRQDEPPQDYDPSRFPAFAVTVDVVILTMSEGVLQALLVCRGEEPFEGMWAIPGGFKRPRETLDAAARRELHEETGVDAASLLTQFGAYGDPERDPRMNVVTVAYLAVLRDVRKRRGRLGRRSRRAASGLGSSQRQGRARVRPSPDPARRDRARPRRSSRSRASRRPSSVRRSPSPSCARSTRPSGACSSTRRTSGGASSRTRAGSSRPGAAQSPARRAGVPPSSTGPARRGSTAARSIERQRDERK